MTAAVLPGDGGKSPRPNACHESRKLHLFVAASTCPQKLRVKKSEDWRVWGRGVSGLLSDDYVQEPYYSVFPCQSARYP